MAYAPPTRSRDTSRPGLTSLIRTARGLMTVQTEIVGEPAQLVALVDFRGRVLKRWQGPVVGAPDDPEAAAQARRWHRQIEAQVRETLRRAGGARAPQPAQAQRARGEAAAHLFAAGARAYAARDYATARALFEACARLLPDDPRVRAALERATSRGR